MVINSDHKELETSTAFFTPMIATLSFFSFYLVSNKQATNQQLTPSFTSTTHEGYGLPLPPSHGQSSAGYCIKIWGSLSWELVAIELKALVFEVVS
jgi:hypothetical protein